MTRPARRLSSARARGALGALGAILVAAGFVACATLPVVPIDRPEDGSVPEAGADVQRDTSDLEAAADADAEAEAASDASLDADADAGEEDADAG